MPMVLPELAASAAPAKFVATARPPGIQPSQRRAVSNAVEVRPDFHSSIPIRMNIGITE